MEAKAKSAEAVKARAVKAQEMVKARASAVKAAALRKRDANELVGRLQAGHAVYSQDFRSDLWLTLKNNHIFFSMFFAHPKHPFTANSRRVCLICSLTLGFGLTCLIDLMRGDPTIDPVAIAMVNIFFGGLVQSVYDNLLKMFAACTCVQSCPAFIRACFRCCGSIGVVVQFFFGLIMLLGGVLALEAEIGNDALNASSWKFAVGKVNAWFFYSILTLSASFALTRRSQMRPEDAKEYEKWNTPQKRCLCICLGPKKPRSELWNKYIGQDKTFADLPLTAPTYKYRLCCRDYGEDTYMPSDDGDLAPDEEQAGDSGDPLAQGSVVVPTAQGSIVVVVQSDTANVSETVLAGQDTKASSQ